MKKNYKALEELMNACHKYMQTIEGDIKITVILPNNDLVLPPDETNDDKGYTFQEFVNNCLWFQIHQQNINKNWYEIEFDSMTYDKK